MALNGKVAVVTGGTRGIGRGIAEAFHRDGATVVMSGRSDEKGAAAVKEMGGDERVAFVRSDARVQAEVEALVDTVADRYGSVDILVNNAGGSGGFALIGDLSDDAWQEAADWILNSTFWATRRVLNGMKARGWGRIINISSVESKFMQQPMAAHYSTFKAASNALARAVALEYGEFGITANSICPGVVETDLTREVGAANAAAQGISYEAFLDAYARETLTRRINTVEEVAAVALLLASDAGAGITGSSINVDAGTSPY